MQSRRLMGEVTAECGRHALRGEAQVAFSEQQAVIKLTGSRTRLTGYLCAKERKREERESRPNEVGTA